MSGPGKLKTLAIPKCKCQKGKCSVQDCNDFVTGRTLIAWACSTWTEITSVTGIHQFHDKTSAVGATLPNTVLFQSYSLLEFSVK